MRENVSVVGKTVSKTGTSRRENTRHYFLQQTRVCKPVFIGTLAVSNGRVNRVLTAGSDPCDNRGKHGHQKTINPVVKELLNQVINDVPKYDSHYHDTYQCDNNDLFLAPNMTLTILYGLLLDKIQHHESLTKDDEPSYTWFSSTFSRNFPNVKIASFKKDTCDTCNVDSISGTSPETHRLEVQQARELYEDNESKSYTIPTDMMDVLSLPKIDTNNVYYRRQLSLYTQGIHWTKKNQAFLYVWLEDDGNKGVTEVITCLHTFLLENPEVYAEKKRVILWTDTPSSQNRNYAMILYLMWCVNNIEGLKTIYHRFFIKGHSYMACDRDYMELMKTSNSRKPPLVKELKPESFLDFSSSMSVSLTSTSKLVDETGNKFYISKCRELMYIKGEDAFQFKYNWLDELKEVKVKAQSSRQNTGITYSPPTKLIDNDEWRIALGATKDKYADLQSLKQFIPAASHSFYDERMVAGESHSVQSRGRGKSNSARGRGNGNSAQENSNSASARCGRGNGSSARRTSVRGRMNTRNNL